MFNSHPDIMEKGESYDLLYRKPILQFSESQWSASSYKCCRIKNSPEDKLLLSIREMIVNEIHRVLDSKDDSDASEKKKLNVACLPQKCSFSKLAVIRAITYS